MIIEVALLTLLITFSATFSTITGFGTSTISIPIMLNFFPLHETLLFVGIIHLVGTVWKMFLFRKGFVQKFFFILIVPAALASFAGAFALFAIPPRVSSALLGGFLVLYVLFLMYQHSFQLKRSNITATIGAMLSGFFAGIFGLGGAIRSVFLHAYNIPKIRCRKT